MVFTQANYLTAPSIRNTNINNILNCTNVCAKFLKILFYAPICCPGFHSIIWRAFIPKDRLLRDSEYFMMCQKIIIIA